MIFFCGRAEQFREERLQGVGPHLITLYGWMQTITHHAIEQLAVFVCKLVVDIQEANLFPSASFARFVLILLIMGIAAMLSFRRRRRI